MRENVHAQSDPLEVAANSLFLRRHPHLDWNKPSPEKKEAYRVAHGIIMGLIDEAMAEIEEEQEHDPY